MCGTCGCAEDASIQLLGGDSDSHPGFAPGHAHAATAGHTHSHGDSARADSARADSARADSARADSARADSARADSARADSARADSARTGAGRTVLLQQNVLEKNDKLAERNRQWLENRRIRAVNLMSSPGAGKTTLLERTARELGGQLVISVIEGDQETSLDAGRIEAAGCKVVQINTGAGCHLDAGMMAAGLRALDPPAGSVVVIENVGNLVCPALFDLGEQAKVVITSVTEGADKPIKYPQMFGVADLVVLNKIDLLPHVEFDTARHAADLAKVSPRAGRAAAVGHDRRGRAGVVRVAVSRRFPVGEVEPGESAEDAAVSDTREEKGLLPARSRYSPCPLWASHG